MEWSGGGKNEEILMQMRDFVFLYVRACVCMGVYIFCFESSFRFVLLSK